MSNAAFCKRCGTSITADAAQGLCPACLLEQGLGGAGGAAGFAGVDETAAMPPSSAGAAAPHAADLARLFPQLEILELLGRGGMGVVYKARQRGLDRMVALKVLPPGVDRDPGFQERFVREARALARMSHPNIVAVHDFGQVEGQYYFLMEYVDGVNLRRMLQSGNLSAGEALGIVPQVCDALQYAHEEGIVHRDIKPENILIDRRGRVKIADFGLAKILSGGAAPERGYTLTASQVVMGTPHYMAPEQFERPNTVDHRADIYSLGVVFYEMLTGELPLGRFPPPSRMVQVDVRLDEVVLRTLEKEPRQRYQRADAVKTELASLASARTSAGFAPPHGAAPAAPAAPAALVWSAGGAPVGRPPAPAPSIAAPPDGPPRVSRAAIWGAVWAPMFFVAVLSLIPTQVQSAVATADGVEPVPFRPVVWVTLLAVTFVTLGAGAPIGTTVLGLVAISKIRRSRGRVIGLPLAVFDALLFPLLLLDLVFVVGLLRLMDPPPDALPKVAWIVCLMALLIDSLLAMWAWRVASRGLENGGAGAPQAHAPAPPPIPPQQQYALRPRRSAAAKVALVCVLLACLGFGGCLIYPMFSARPGRPSPLIMAAPERDAAFGESVQGQRSYRFLVRGPDNCKATFWLEWWRGGQLVRTPGFNQRQWVVTQAGLPFDGTVMFTTDADPALGGRLRAAWRIEGNAGVTASSGVIDDPFRDMVIRDSTWGVWTGGWQVAAGRTYTMLVLRGARERLVGTAGDAQFARQSDVELRLMARFDPLDPGEAKIGPSFGAAADPPADVTSMLPQRTSVVEHSADTTVRHGDLRVEATAGPPAGSATTATTTTIPATLPAAPAAPRGPADLHEEHGDPPHEAPEPHGTVAPADSHGEHPDRGAGHTR